VKMRTFPASGESAKSTSSPLLPKTCVCEVVCVCVCACVCACVHMDTPDSARVYVYACITMCVCMFLCVHVCACVCGALDTPMELHGGADLGAARSINI